MAVNVGKNPERDIRQEGIQGLRGLDALEAEDLLNKAIIDADRNAEIAALINKSRNSKVSSLLKEIDEATPVDEDITDIATQLGLGESKYDLDVTSMATLLNLADYRGRELSGIALVAAGMAKGAITAGTTFLESTIFDTLWGAGLAVSNRQLSKFWDNEFTRAMKSVLEWSEKAMPNYYTDEQRANLESGDWYKNVFSANFIGDSIIKNAGFTLGAGAGLLAGGEASAALGLFSKIAKSAKKGINAAKKSKGIANAAKEASAVKNEIADGTTALSKYANLSDEAIKADLQASKAALRADFKSASEKLGSGLSQLGASAYANFRASLGEGAIEAMENAEEAVKDKRRQILEEALARLEDIYREYGNTAEGLQRALEVERQRNQALRNLEEYKASVGNADMLLNIPVLMVENALCFGSAFLHGKGMKEALKTTFAEGSVKDALKMSDKTLNKVVGGEIKAMEAAKNNMFKKAWAFAKRPLLEGNEEVAQKAVAEAAKDYYGYDVMDPYYNETNPKWLSENKSWFESMVHGAAESYGKILQSEDFAIGALMGLIGPKPKKFITKGEDGNYHITGSPIGIEFGALESLRENNEKYEAAAKLADEYNRIVSQPDFVKQYNDTVMLSAINDGVEKATLAGDEEKLDLLKLQQVFKAILLLNHAGLTDSIQDLLTKAKSMDVGDLQKLKEESASSLGDNVFGKYNLLLENDVNDMKLRVVSGIDKFLDEIEAYKLADEYYRAAMLNDINGNEIPAERRDEFIDSFVWRDVNAKYIENRAKNTFAKNQLNLLDAINWKIEDLREKADKQKDPNELNKLLDLIAVFNKILKYSNDLDNFLNMHRYKSDGSPVTEDDIKNALYKTLYDTTQELLEEYNKMLFNTDWSKEYAEEEGKKSVSKEYLKQLGEGLIKALQELDALRKKREALINPNNFEGLTPEEKTAREKEIKESEKRLKELAELRELLRKLDEDYRKKTSTTGKSSLFKRLEAGRLALYKKQKNELKDRINELLSKIPSPGSAIHSLDMLIQKAEDALMSKETLHDMLKKLYYYTSLEKECKELELKEEELVTIANTLYKIAQKAGLGLIYLDVNAVMDTVSNNLDNLHIKPALKGAITKVIKNLLKSIEADKSKSNTFLWNEVIDNIANKVAKYTQEVPLEKVTVTDIDPTLKELQEKQNANYEERVKAVQDITDMINEFITDYKEFVEKCNDILDKEDKKELKGVNAIEKLRIIQNKLKKLDSIKKAEAEDFQAYYELEQNGIYRNYTFMNLITSDMAMVWKFRLDLATYFTNPAKLLEDHDNAVKQLEEQTTNEELAKTEDNILKLTSVKDLRDYLSKLTPELRAELSNYFDPNVDHERHRVVRDYINIEDYRNRIASRINNDTTLADDLKTSLLKAWNKYCDLAESILDVIDPLNSNFQDLTSLLNDYAEWTSEADILDGEINTRLALGKYILDENTANVEYNMVPTYILKITLLQILDKLNKGQNVTETPTNGIPEYTNDTEEFYNKADSDYFRAIARRFNEQPKSSNVDSWKPAVMSWKPLEKEVTDNGVTYKLGLVVEGYKAMHAYRGAPLIDGMAGFNVHPIWEFLELQGAHKFLDNGLLVYHYLNPNANKVHFIMTDKYLGDPTAGRTVFMAVKVDENDATDKELFDGESYYLIIGSLPTSTGTNGDTELFVNSMVDEYKNASNKTIVVSPYTTSINKIYSGYLDKWLNFVSLNTVSLPKGAFLGYKRREGFSDLNGNNIQNINLRDNNGEDAGAICVAVPDNTGLFLAIPVMLQRFNDTYDLNTDTANVKNKVISALGIFKDLISRVQDDNSNEFVFYDKNSPELDEFYLAINNIVSLRSNNSIEMHFSINREESTPKWVITLDHYKVDEKGDRVTEKNDKGEVHNVKESSDVIEFTTDLKKVKWDAVADELCLKLQNSNLLFNTLGFSLEELMPLLFTNVDFKFKGTWFTVNKLVAESDTFEEKESEVYESTGVSGSTFPETAITNSKGTIATITHNNTNYKVTFNGNVEMPEITTSDGKPALLGMIDKWSIIGNAYTKVFNITEDTVSVANGKVCLPWNLIVYDIKSGKVSDSPTEYAEIKNTVSKKVNETYQKAKPTAPKSEISILDLMYNRILELTYYNNSFIGIDDAHNYHIMEDGKLRTDYLSVHSYIKSPLGLLLGSTGDITPEAIVGTLYDGVCRDVINGKNVTYEQFAKLKVGIKTAKDYVTELAFTELVEGLKKFLSNHPKERFISAGLIVTSKYTDSTGATTRVAGELDLIGIDEQGAITIYDFKTMKKPWGNGGQYFNTGRYYDSHAEHTLDGLEIKVTYGESYTALIYSYVNMLSAMLGENVVFNTPKLIPIILAMTNSAGVILEDGKYGNYTSYYLNLFDDKDFTKRAEGKGGGVSVGAYVLDEAPLYIETIEKEGKKERKSILAIAPGNNGHRYFIKGNLKLALANSDSQDSLAPIASLPVKTANGFSIKGLLISDYSAKQNIFEGFGTVLEFKGKTLKDSTGKPITKGCYIEFASSVSSDEGDFQTFTSKVVGVNKDGDLILATPYLYYHKKDNELKSTVRKKPSGKSLKIVDSGELELKLYDSLSDEEKQNYFIKAAAPTPPKDTNGLNLLGNDNTADEEVEYKEKGEEVTEAELGGKSILDFIVGHEDGYDCINPSNPNGYILESDGEDVSLLVWQVFRNRGGINNIVYDNFKLYHKKVSNDASETPKEQKSNKDTSNDEDTGGLGMMVTHENYGLGLGLDKIEVTNPQTPKGTTTLMGALNAMDNPEGKDNTGGTPLVFNTDPSKQGTGNNLIDFVLLALNDSSKTRRALDLNRISNAELAAEIEWLKTALPWLDRELRIKLVSTLGDPNVWGKFYHNCVYLRNNNIKGTTYHEAFHAVFNMCLNLSERLKLIRLMLSLYPNLDRLTAEELMAEKFREYMEDLELPGLLNSIKSAFRKITRFLSKVLGIHDALLDVFLGIQSGRYKERPISKIGYTNAEIIRSINFDNGAKIYTTDDKKLLLAANMLYLYGNAITDVEKLTGFTLFNDRWKKIANVKFNKDKLTNLLKKNLATEIGLNSVDELAIIDYGFGSDLELINNLFALADLDATEFLDNILSTPIIAMSDYKFLNKESKDRLKELKINSLLWDSLTDEERDTFAECSL